MRGTAKVFTVASVALLSCRAVLGIEEIEDGTLDGGAADGGGTDAPADSVVIDTGDAGICSDKTGTECGKCCRQAGGPGYKEELEPIIKPCLCGGACAGDCLANLCDGGDPVGSNCIPCMDDEIQAQKCVPQKTECYAKSANCRLVWDCIAACK